MQFLSETYEQADRYKRYPYLPAKPPVGKHIIAPSRSAAAVPGKNGQRLMQASAIPAQKELGQRFQRDGLALKPPERIKSSPRQLSGNPA